MSALGSLTCVQLATGPTEVKPDPLIKLFGVLSASNQLLANAAVGVRTSALAVAAVNAIATLAIELANTAARVIVKRLVAFIRIISVVEKKYQSKIREM